MPTPRRTLTWAAAVGTLAALVALTAGTASAASAPAGMASHVTRTAGGPTASRIVYTAHTQTLSANGTRLPSAACPAGDLPVGGGTAVQDPRTEQVLQAGFRSGAPGSVVGYQASVRVHGLRRGSKVKVAVQVACAPAPQLPIYGPLA